MRNKCIIPNIDINWLLSHNQWDVLRFRQHQKGRVNWSRELSYDAFLEVSQLQQCSQRRRCHKAHSCENVTEVKKRHWLQIARTFSIQRVKCYAKKREVSEWAYAKKISVFQVQNWVKYGTYITWKQSSISRILLWEVFVKMLNVFSSISNSWFAQKYISIKQYLRKWLSECQHRISVKLSANGPKIQKYLNKTKFYS